MRPVERVLNEGVGVWAANYGAMLWQLSNSVAILIAANRVKSSPLHHGKCQSEY